MTRITSLASAGPIRGGTLSRAGGARGFAVATASSSAPAPVTSVGLGALIGLQEDCRPEARDRAARRGGDRVLGALGRLQVATLSGGDSGALATLYEAVMTMTEPADPVLAGILGAIRLRARVELARQGR